MAKRRGQKLDLPVQVFRNSVTTAADGVPVYDPVEFDLQFEANEVMRLLRLEMWIANVDAMDDPPEDGMVRVRAALLDDPQAEMDIATAGEFDTRPEIVDYHEVVIASQVDAAPANKVVLPTSFYKRTEFPDGGLLVGRNMRYTLVMDETASIFGLGWELRTQLWAKRERVPDSTFRKILYSIRYPG